MTPFFWYSVAMITLSVLAGMGLMAMWCRPWAPRLCALDHQLPTPPGMPQPRPRPEGPPGVQRGMQREETAWSKLSPPRHSRSTPSSPISPKAPFQDPYERPLGWNADRAAFEQPGGC